MQTSYAASMIGVCSNGLFSVDNCPASEISFPAFETVNGKANFLFRTDEGNLGDLNNQEASTAVDDILGIWEDVSSVDFIKDGNGKIDIDVNASNFGPFLDPADPLGFSPIIFDANGELVDNLIGNGARNSVLGFAGATFFETNNNGKVEFIVESQALFNGFLFDDSNRNDLSGADEILNEFKTTILHEFAHMLGIDHSQGGLIEEFVQASNGQNVDLSDIPIMFPIAANPLLELKRDDIAAINIKYPLNSISNNSGTIKGQILSNGEPVIGANVIAFNVDNPLEEHIACPSDVDGQGTGNFEIPGLSPGNYIVAVEPIFSDFDGGSSVGLHDPPSPNTIPSGFFNGSTENIILSSDLNTGLNQAQRISLSAGETVENIILDIDNGDISNIRTFSLKGKSLQKAIRLKVNKPKTVKFKIIQENKDLDRVVLSTNFPNLTSFKKSEIVFNKNKKTAKITFASLNDFLEDFPEILIQGLEIQLTVQDADSGFIDSTQSFFIF